MGVKKSGSGLNTGAALVAAAFRGGRLRLNSEARSPGFFYLSSLKARLSNLNSGRSNGSFPVISSPYFGHEHVPEVCRIHSASPRLMTESRLHLAGPTRCGSRISIGLVPAKHVKSGFGQMPRHCAHRLVVPFAGAQSGIQLADVPLRKSPIVHRRGISRFRKGPFQIAIHVRPGASVAHAISAGMHTWHGSRVRS